MGTLGSMALLFISGQSILKQIGQRFLGRKKLKNKTSVTTSSGTYDSVDSTQDDSTSDGMDETETTCILEIYAEGSQKVDDAFKRLKAGLDHEWYSQKIEDSAILKLDTKQVCFFFCHRIHVGNFVSRASRSEEKICQSSTFGSIRYP